MMLAVHHTRTWHQLALHSYTLQLTYRDKNQSSKFKASSVNRSVTALRTGIVYTYQSGSADCVYTASLEGIPGHFTEVIAS